jgi:hypothetical protein
VLGQGIGINMMTIGCRLIGLPGIEGICGCSYREAGFRGYFEG